MKVLNKLKQTLADWRYDGTDPRKNNERRVLPGVFILPAIGHFIT